MWITVRTMEPWYVEHHPYIHIPKSIKFVCGYTTIRISTYQSPSNLVCGFTTIRISTYQSPSSWHVDIPPSVFGCHNFLYPYFELYVLKKALIPNLALDFQLDDSLDLRVNEAEMNPTTVLKPFKQQSKTSSTTTAGGSLDFLV
ncbi:hypothetical protein AVEN_35653-1 [Araneus ventricosus]|uniref:Uncharacterized protein n=1 Tax=Araneus ventricosus TaxID=182803 RepID=A0A4Y2RVT3_ARAVE|nr:hypothetical protein AVEN_35653-1 [Araneus ventricosus]